MRDEIFDREYQAGREALNDSVVATIALFGSAFSALNRRQYAAPWLRRSQPRCEG